MRFLIAVFLSFSVTIGGTASAGVREELRSLLSQDLSKVDLARIKITIDKMVDRSINVEREVAKVDQMVAAIKRMTPRGADDYTQLETIRRYIYEAGEWNNFKPFEYDHDDPYGKEIGNRILADYMQDKQGNCITMPFLFIILGQRLGLNVTASVAPLHVYMKFTDSQGNTRNIEATSGGYFARDVHYRKNFPIADLAIAKGVYMKTLTKQETVAVMAVVLVEDLIQRKHYREAISVADEVLKHYPNYAYAMVKKGTAAYYLLKSNFYEKYPKVSDVPEGKRNELAYLQRINQTSFDKADSLGWKPFKR